MAKHYKITRVYNKDSNKLHVGFLGKNGVTLGPAGSGTGYYDEPGDLASKLTRRPDLQDQLQTLVSGGTLELVPLKGTTETDAVYNEEYVVFKKSFATGTAETTIFNAAVPTALEIVDGHVIVTTAATRSAKDVTSGTINFQLRDGAVGVAAATGLTQVEDIGTTAAGTGGAVVRFGRLINSVVTLARGDSLVAAVTATHANCQTGTAAGTVIVKAIKIA